MASILKAYPLRLSEFIATVNIGKNEFSSVKHQKPSVETVMIIDRSSSMSGHFHAVITRVLPEFFKLLSYDPNDKIHLITFDSSVEKATYQVKDFETLEIHSRGCTYMAPAIEKLHEHLSQISTDKFVRILTISDGEVHDQANVTTASARIYRYASSIDAQINSQAVRLFTSSCQPDTTALCSLLQLNNATPSTLLDIPASTAPKEIAALMEKLFHNDISNKTSQITADSQIFFKNPWDSAPTDSLWLHSGENIFWIKELPTASHNIKIDMEQLREIKVETELTLGGFHALVEQKLEFIVNHLKILKIVGTKEALETVSKIVEYFDQQESILQYQKIAKERAGVDSELSMRCQRIVARANKKISLILAELANDDKVSELNSAQKADYLRQMDVSKSSRGLAKRAMKEGFNFDKIARNEVSEMAKHIDELKDVDDEKHQRSFVSLETTLGGIRYLANLTNEDAFFDFSVIDILELFNFVGVACFGPIGDYADPMTWKIQEIYPYTFVSLSDLLAGGSLKVPGTRLSIYRI
jgi:Mg-chelatase subunit ChlD